MKRLSFIIVFIVGSILISCKNDRLEEKGFQINQIADFTENNSLGGFENDSLKFETRPSNVLLTGISNIRITPIYKVNINKNKNTSYIGTNSFHYKYEDLEENKGNNWNSNIIPGFKAVFGFNMVNISLYDFKTNKQKYFFEKPILVKTLYYPTFPIDTLNFKPVRRTYFIVSVYNDDTNNDSFLNLKDLRRLYLFDINGEKQRALIPENYAVIKSEYDLDNDYMYVFAQLDSNNNGQKDEGEPIHIFWINLQDPFQSGRTY